MKRARLFAVFKKTDLYRPVLYVLLAAPPGNGRRAARRKGMKKWLSLIVGLKNFNLILYINVSKLERSWP